MIKISCPYCQQRLAIPTDDFARILQCPRCKASLEIAALIPKGQTVLAVDITPIPPAIASSVQSVGYEQQRPALQGRDQQQPPVSSNEWHPPSSSGWHPPFSGEWHPPSSSEWQPPPSYQPGVSSSLRTADPGGASLGGTSENAGRSTSGSSGQEQYGNSGYGNYIVGTNGSLVVPQSSPQPENISQKNRVFSQWILDVCESVDCALLGWRTRILAICVVLASLGGWLLEEGYGAELVSKGFPEHVVLLPGLLLLGLVLLILGIAKVGSFRNEDGIWSSTLVFQELEQGILTIVDSVKIFFEVPGYEKLKMLGRAGIGVAFVTLAISNLNKFIQGLFFWIIGSSQGYQEWIEMSDHLVEGAGILLFVSSLLWIAGWWYSKDSSLVQKVKATQTHHQYSFHGATWPSPIDCKRDNIEEIVERIPDPVLSEVLTLLAEWKPKKYPRELGYQGDLEGFLRRKMPGAVQREVSVGKRSDGTLGRADFVLAGHVLVEMKYRLTKQSADKALGQVLRYCQAWREKPVLLLLCDSQISEQNCAIVKDIQALQQQSQVGIVIARN